MSMQIINKNEGEKIQYEVMNKSVFFNDAEIMVNVEKRQRDYPVQIDICRDRDNNLVIGAAAGLYYVAQIDVPAAEYIYPDPVSINDEGMMDGESAAPEKVPFTMDDVTMTLWALENPVEITEEIIEEMEEN